jgi:hypothetical protein
MSDAGSLINNHEFISDLCRYAEGIFTEAAVKKKWHFDDVSWKSLGEDEALVEAIELEKTRRTRNGSTARERAQVLFAETPTVLGNILRDDGMSPRHRIEAAREIRQVAANEAENRAADRFVINIDLGADYKLTIDKERGLLTPDEAKRLNDDKIIESTAIRPGPERP